MSALLIVPVLVVTVLVFATVIRRLLGVRVGLVRTLLAAVLALVVTAPIRQALAPPDPDAVSGGEAVLLVLAAAIVAALLAMAVLVILDVLLPTGSLPAPTEGVRRDRPRADRRGLGGPGARGPAGGRHRGGGQGPAAGDRHHRGA